MKIILKQDIKNLGKKDTIVEVSDGYANNYLLPRKLAVPATAGNMNDVENKHQAAAMKQQREKELAQKSADIVSGKTIVIKAKAGDNGKLFGAVASKDISDGIKAQLGADIDKKKIILDEPIKSVGTYDVEAKVYTGIVAKFKVRIDG